MMKRLLLVLVLLCAVGCSMGPKKIRQNYADYNQTIHYNQSQEMLLNLVRLKYREVPLFMKVGSLTTSYNYGGSASADAGRRFSDLSFGAGVSGNYSERPTITYSPIEGNTFVKQLLAEIDRSTFVLLLRAGWPLRLLCHLTIERIGNDFNDPDRESYDRFSELCEILHESQELDLLEPVMVGDEAHLSVRTTVVDLSRPEIRGDTLVEHRIPTSDFQLRSFLDVMFFLGKNTQIPPDHRDQVRASDPTDWISIRYHQSPPEDALVWIAHNGYFFSIANNDVQSKDTFALVKLLFEMQAGDIATAQPVLTLSAD